MCGSIIASSTLRALSTDPKALLFLVYYGKIASSLEIRIDFLKPYTIGLEKRLLA